MIRAHIAWVWHRIGYMIRPYDMIADARRWVWQPREECQWSRASASPWDDVISFYMRKPERYLK